MSAPVAGRRKGQATEATNSFFSQPTSQAADSEPSWLTGATTTTAAATTAPAGPPPTQSVAPPRPNAATDPLDFLSFDDPAPPTRPPAAATSAPIVTPTAQAASGGLDFLDFSEPARPPVLPPAATPVADTGYTLFSTGNDPYTRPNNDRLVREYESLFAQFTQLDDELAHSAAVVSAIEGGSHDVIREYDMAESELTQLEHKVTEAREAVAQTHTSQQTELRAQTAAAATSQAAQKAAAVEAAQAEWAERLQKVTEAVSARRATLATTRAEYEAMHADVATTSVTDSAVRGLETRLGGLVRGMRADFGLLVKPLLTRTIQSEIAEAAQQRAEIHRIDAKKRREALHERAASRMEAFTAFLAQRAEVRTTASDNLFGELKRDLESFRATRASERHRRLGEFQASLRESYETSRAAVHARVKQQTELDERSVAQELDTRATEERLLRERLTQQLALFRDRAAEERKLVVRASLACASSVEQPSPRWQSPTGPSSSSFLVDTAMPRMRQLQQDVRADRERWRAALSAQSSLSSHSTALSTAREQLVSRKRAVEEAFRQSDASLARWRSAVAPLSAVVSRLGTTLQSRRVQLSGLHASVRESRRLWETDIRRALSQSLVSCGGADGEALTWPADAMTDILHDLTSRLDQHRLLEQQLRDGRVDFVHMHEAQMQRLKRAYVASNDKLGVVFSSYEQVTRTGAQLEAHRIALEAAAEDLEAAQAALVRDQATAVALHARIQQQARQAEQMGSEIDAAVTPFEDVTPHYANRQNTAAATITTTTDSSSSRSVSHHADGRSTAKADYTSHGLPPSPQQRRPIPSQRGSYTKPNSTFPPTPVRYGDLPLSRSPAQRQAGPRRYGQHDPSTPQTGAVSDASPQSALRSTTTTLATDFSTSLLGFDDEDDDMTNMDDTGVSEHGPDALYQDVPPYMPPRPYVTRTSPSVDAVPHVDQTNFGRSLTTPSTSE